MSKLKNETYLKQPTNNLVFRKQAKVNKNKVISNVISFLGSLICLFILLGLLLFSGCQKGEDTVVLVDQEEFNADERQIISENLQKMINEETSAFSVLDPHANPGVTALYEYLNRNFQSLVHTERVVHRDNLVWSIHILQDDETKNTFITPGGAMYITTGMLKTIRTEHELINILAHEMMYADGAIVLEKLKSEYGGDILFEIIAGKNPSELLDMALALPNIVYSESEVLEADSYAVDIICDFLYDPHGMRDFLKRIIDNNQKLQWLDNRPSSEDRYILVEQSASGCGPGSTFEGRYQDLVSKLP